MAVLDFTTLFKDRGATRGVDNLAKTFTKAAGSATDLETATKKLAAAEQKVADAAGAVRVAEAKLGQIRNNAKATAAQRLAAEENLAKAQRRHVGALREAAVAGDRAAAAMRRGKVAMEQTATATRHAGDEAEKTSGRFKRAMGGMRAFGSAGVNATGKVVGGFKMVGLGAAGVATGILAAAAAPVTFGLKTAAAMENAEIAFTTMLGSARKARRFLDDLKKFAAATPFEFPELQDAASSLISVGINAKNVIPIMTTLGNVTSGMGTGAEGVKRATIAIQQMSASGRISAEDLNQLRDAGIPLNLLFDAMAKRLGTTSKKLMEMREDGKLGRKELDALMASLQSGRGFDRFNGLMDKQSRSLNGMLSTLKDTFGQGMANALQSSIPFIKEGIKAVTNTLGTYFRWAEVHQEQQVAGFIAIGDSIFGLAETFLTLNQSALNAIGDISNAIGNLLVKLGKKEMGQGFLDLGATAKIAAGEIGGKLTPKIQDAHSKWTKFGQDRRTEAAMRDGNARIQRALADTTQAIKKNGRTLSLHTEEGARNRRALRNLAETNLDYIGKLRRNEASTKKVEKATSDARQMFIRTAVKMGASSEEAQRLANKFGLLDRKIRTISNKHVKIKFSADTKWKDSSGVKWSVNLSAPSRVGGVATGGYIQGPGTGTSDSIPAMLSNGEFVIKASETKKHRELLEAINAGKAGPTPHFAKGGYVSIDYLTRKLAPADRARGNIERIRDTYARRFGEEIAKGMAKYVSPAFGAFNLPSGGNAIGRGQAALIRYGRMLGMSASTYPGHHPSMAKARDFMPVSGGRGDAMAAHAWKNARPYGVWYVIWNRHIASRTRPGAGWRPYTRYGSSGSPSQMHTNHVHVAWYDRGGMLRPGQTGTNESGQPERVLTPSNTKSFDKLVRVMDRSGGAANTYITINAPNYVGSQDDLRRTLVDMNRRGQLEVIKQR